MRYYEGFISQKYNKLMSSKKAALLEKGWFKSIPDIQRKELTKPKVATNR